MRENITSLAELPLHHPGMLLVRLRSSANASAQVPAMATVQGAAPGWSSSWDNPPSLQALSAYERRGLIRRVVAIASQGPLLSNAFGEQSVLTQLAARIDGDAKPSNGTSLIELTRDDEPIVNDLWLALANDPMVDDVSRVPMRYFAAAAPSEPASPASQWNLRKIHLRQARGRSGFREALDIKVGVLDSGVDDSHPALQKRIEHYTHAYPSILSVSARSDLVGHGTHVCGIIGAELALNEDEPVGVEGVCRPEIYVWKVCSDQATWVAPMGAFLYVVEPIMYRRALGECAENGLDVLNLSLGGTAVPDFDEKEQIARLIAGNTTVVAAMGNHREKGSPIQYPAALPDVIAIGATLPSDKIANFSNRGDHIALCAPGRAIWSCMPTYRGQIGYHAQPGTGGAPMQGKPMWREEQYAAMDGTSMAAPHVTAAIALRLANAGVSTPQDVKRMLMQSADKVREMNKADFDPDYGAGRLNVEKLLAL